jgi:hypothetical protein
MTQAMDRAFKRVTRLMAGLRLPGVEHGTSYGTPALKVSGKSFVRLKDAETLVLLCPIEAKEMLLEVAPHIYYQTDHYLGWPAVLVRLAEIGDEELSMRLRDCWVHKAPPRLRQAAGVKPAE